VTTDVIIQQVKDPEDIEGIDPKLYEVKLSGYEIGRVWEHPKGYCETICIPYKAQRWNSTGSLEDAVNWLVEVRNKGWGQIEERQGKGV
jgi:hypothetical protein